MSEFDLDLIVASKLLCWLDPQIVSNSVHLSKSVSLSIRQLAYFEQTDRAMDWSANFGCQSTRSSTTF